MGSSVAPGGHKARVTKRLATSSRCCWSARGEGRCVEREGLGEGRVLYLFIGLIAGSTIAFATGN